MDHKWTFEDHILNIVQKLNQNHNKLHERALRIVYKDHFSLFEDKSDGKSKSKSVTAHERNFQILATEMCEILNSYLQKS